VREPYERVGKRTHAGMQQLERRLDRIFSRPAKEWDPTASRIKVVGAAAHEQSAPGAMTPSISYIDLRFATEGRTASSKKARRSLAGAHCSGDDGERVPTIRKFFVCLRASGPVRAIDQCWFRKVLPLRRNAARYLAEAMTDKTIPVEQVYLLGVRFAKPLCGTHVTRPPALLRGSLPDVRKRPLFQNWPKESNLLPHQREFLQGPCWAARGHTLGARCDDQGWKLLVKDSL